MNLSSNRWLEHACRGSYVAVHADQPVAVVRRACHSQQVISWSDLDVGLGAVTSIATLAPTGLWVFYSPSGSDDPALSPGRPAAVHVSFDGDLIVFADLGESFPMGATRHGLWLSHDQATDPEDGASWLALRSMSVLGVDGVRSSVTLDRQPTLVVERDGAALVFVYAGIPDGERDASGGVTYAYRFGALPIPDALPEELLVPASGLRLEPEEEFLRLMQASVVPTSEDPLEVADYSWERVELTREAQLAAVSAVTNEFSNLDRYWLSEGGEASPISEGLEEPRVEVIGEWPDTRVEVSFAHPRYAEGRLRRTLRVFDSAGRVASVQYASIYLMEDLDTGAVPDVHMARNGILDM